MNRVVLDVSMSLDGFTAGPNMREAEPMGTAAKRAEQAAGDNDVLVLGVDVARQSLTAALLDELCLHLVPLLLGAGTPLFDGGSRPS